MTQTWLRSEAEVYRREYEVRDTYWWYIARRALIRQALRRWRVLQPTSMVVDIGAGSAAMGSLWQSHPRVLGLDRDWDAVLRAQSSGYRWACQSDVYRLPFTDGSIDVLAAFDVFEHLPDDAAAIRECCRVLKPQGHLLCLMPAFQALWSDQDRVVHHYRRYHAQQCRTLLTAHALRILQLTYCFSFLWPMVALVAVGQRWRARAHPLRAHLGLAMPSLVNQGLIGVCALERLWLRRGTLPFGTSLLCVAQKDVGCHDG